MTLVSKQNTAFAVQLMILFSFVVLSVHVLSTCGAASQSIHNTVAALVSAQN